MRDVFGMGGSKGREDYGLRFSSVETAELLDYEGAEVLLIASKAGKEGMEEKLGEEQVKVRSAFNRTSDRADR